MLVAFQYWRVANKIYKFTTKGILPKETSKYRRKAMLLVLSVTSIMATLTFLFLIQLFALFYHRLLMDGQLIEKLIKVFMLCSLVTMIMTLCFYAAALQRLYKIKSMAQHSGCLNPKIIIVNFITYGMFIASMVLCQFKYDYGLFTLMIVIMYYILFFLVVSGIVYILMSFQLTNFNIITQCEGNTVAVIGQGLNGHEKFKFIIGCQQLQGVNQIKNLDFFLKKSHNSKTLDPDGTKEPLRLSGDNSDFSDTDDGQT